jgi:hypothetical protein
MLTAELNMRIMAASMIKVVARCQSFGICRSLLGVNGSHSLHVIIVSLTFIGYVIRSTSGPYGND